MNTGSAVPTVLVVHALDDVRAATVRALEAASFQTLDASDGPAALAIARRDSLDLIVSQAPAPDMDSLALCRAIRGDRRLTGIPIVLIGGRDDAPATTVAALNAGADEYLAAPVDRAMLVARARALLAHRALEVELARVNGELAASVRSGETLRAAFEHALDSVLIADSSGRYVDANPAACALFGLKKDELIGRRVAEFIAAGIDFDAIWSDFLEKGARTGAMRCRRANGHEFYAEIAARANIVPGRHLAVVRDVTERKRLDEHIRGVQRLEAVGRLAGGIAHDFNNLLTVILGAAELLTEELPKGGSAWHQATETHSAATRAAALTSQLLAFSRRQLLRPSRVDLGALVREMLPTLQRLVGDQVAISIATADAVPTVRVDKGQFGQVIVNLVTNARDAMPDGGTLIIETSRVHLDARYAAKHVGVVSGPYVLLAISDTGTGIDASTQKRIFEPFFTTRAMGRGTGLGLSTAYGIVKQSGGNIWVYSEPNRGTTFKIYVPEAAGVVAAAARGDRQQLTRGEGKVLLVEDEPGVRAIAHQILKRCGYRVTVASDGPDALVQCGDGVHFDLVITDVVMPGMSGSELVSRLRARRPGLRVLYTSGYTEDAVIHHGVAAGAHFLAKPFTPSDLARKVRQVLEAPPTDLSAAS